MLICHALTIAIVSGTTLAFSHAYEDIVSKCSIVDWASIDHNKTTVVAMNKKFYVCMTIE